MKMLLLNLMQTLNRLTTRNPWMWNLFIAGIFISFQKAALNDSSSKVTFKIYMTINWLFWSMQIGGHN